MVVISQQTVSPCRWVIRVARRHTAIWLVDQTVSSARTWDKAQASWSVCNSCRYLHHTTPSCRLTYWQAHMTNPQRFAASLSASHTHSRLPSTHIPTVASMLNSQSCGNKAPSHRDLLCIRNPWFTWLSPPRTALYCTMNAVTSRQCQGERNMSEPPQWAFPRSGSLQLMIRAWRASPQPGRARWAQMSWLEGEEDTDCNHRQSSALSVDFCFSGLDSLAPNLWFKLVKKKDKEGNKDL